MDSLKFIFPLVGVLFGWFLSELSKYSISRKEDKKKLKRLLFFLLELRFQFVREHSLEHEIGKYSQMATDKVLREFGEEAIVDFEIAEQVIKEVLKQNLFHEDKYQFLVDNIDIVLFDLAEIDPILAYELSGQHEVKKRLLFSQEFIAQLEPEFGVAPFDINELIKPQLTENLIKDLDKSIISVGSRISSSTKSKTLKKMKRQDSPVNTNNEIEELIDQYIERVKESYSQ